MVAMLQSTIFIEWNTSGSKKVAGKLNLVQHWDLDLEKQVLTFSFVLVFVSIIAQISWKSW